MIMPPDSFVYDHILIRYGELSTKGKNRKDFIKQPAHQCETCAEGCFAMEMNSTHDRMYIHLNGERSFAVKDVSGEGVRHQFVFVRGRVDSDIEAIKATMLTLARRRRTADLQGGGQTE